MVRRRPSPLTYATVPQLLPQGGTVLALGSGPSLTQADVDQVRASVSTVIAVNDSYKLAPDATVLYAADSKWWGWHKGARTAHTVGTVTYPVFTGRFAYCLSHTPFYPDVQILQRGPAVGLSRDPQRLALGLNGVYQAINLAVHLGATRIVLLGVDMHGGHFFGQHPDRTAPPFALCLQRFATLVEPLREAGVEVVNCTPKSALTVFPQSSIAETLGLAVAV